MKRRWIRIKENRVRDIMPVHEVENYSGSVGCFSKSIPELKKNNYWVERSMTVSGDAPKELLHIYEYSKSNTFHKVNFRKCPLYIAKTGHKWYPNESITEYLLNRLGVVFGLKMADCRLMRINGQVRFLSKYFLSPRTEELVHGAEIFAGYLSDSSFVEEVEEANLSRDFFTLQFVEKAVSQRFPDEHQEIMHDLVKLLLFDALVGNNDRHFFNWAVIRPMMRNGQARFSPVYDTARGLFWNDSDQNLEKWKHPKQMAAHIKKYSEASRPKLGWVGEKNINHFRLVEQIYGNEFYMSKEEVKTLFSERMINEMKCLIKGEFADCFSQLRMDFIIKCLECRYQTIKEIII